MQYLHIRGAHLLDPSNQLDTIADMYIADGKIQTIGQKPANGDITQTIDADGKVLIPGLIDLGAHLPEPGAIISEARAACSSGFTHVCALPDTHPVADSPAVVQLILEKSAQAGFAEILPLGAVTKKLAGEQLANMVSLVQAGCLALSNARNTVKNSYVLRRVMEYAATYDIRLFLSANDISLAADGCMHEGASATRMGLNGIPETAETIALAQILLMAEQTGTSLHISQISCARSVQMLRQARQNGIRVSADVPLANLLYTDEAVTGYNSLFHVQPPLRSEEDRQALLQLVNKGDLAISSNHRPHELAAKKAPFSDAESGLSMFDCFLPLALSLVEREELSLNSLIKATSLLPAQILGGTRHGLREGHFLNAALVDAQAEVRLSDDHLHSKGRNIPCLGQTLKGKVEALFIDGSQVI